MVQLCVSSVLYRFASSAANGRFVAKAHINSVFVATVDDTISMLPAMLLIK